MNWPVSLSPSRRSWSLSAPLFCQSVPTENWSCWSTSSTRMYVTLLPRYQTSMPHTRLCNMTTGFILEEHRRIQANINVIKSLWHTPFIDHQLERHLYLATGGYVSGQEGEDMTSKQLWLRVWASSLEDSKWTDFNWCGDLDSTWECTQPSVSDVIVVVVFLLLCFLGLTTLIILFLLSFMRSLLVTLWQNCLEQICIVCWLRDP